MRKIFLLLLFLLFINNCTAQSIKLTWNANTEADLAGYKIYYGESSRTYNTVINLNTDTVKVINGFEVGKIYYFAITAYDTANNESGFSNEVSILIKLKDKTAPAKVVGVKIELSGNGDFVITVIKPEDYE